VLCRQRNALIASRQSVTPSCTRRTCSSCDPGHRAAGTHCNCNTQSPPPSQLTPTQHTQSPQPSQLHPTLHKKPTAHSATSYTTHKAHSPVSYLVHYTKSPQPIRQSCAVTHRLLSRGSQTRIPVWLLTRISQAGDSVVTTRDAKKTMTYVDSDETVFLFLLHKEEVTYWFVQGHHFMWQPSFVTSCCYCATHVGVVAAWATSTQ
jgi:hypothetical protein